MAPAITPEQKNEIIELMVGGGKIAAIKKYREITGMGLKEAKEAVEALGASLAEENPSQYAAMQEASKGGCASVILVGFLLGLGWVASHQILG